MPQQAEHQLYALATTATETVIRHAVTSVLLECFCTAIEPGDKQPSRGMREGRTLPSRAGSTAAAYT